MGSAGSVSKEQLTEEQVKTMIERFCYLDENNDGTISLEELKLEHRNFDGDAYDEGDMFPMSQAYGYGSSAGADSFCVLLLFGLWRFSFRFCCVSLGY